MNYLIQKILAMVKKKMDKTKKRIQQRYIGEMKEKGEISDKPSMTMPDQALTIKELVNKHMINTDLPDPINQDEDLYKMSKMSKIEQIEFVRNAKKAANTQMKKTVKKKLNEEQQKRNDERESSENNDRSEKSVPSNKRPSEKEAETGSGSKK